VFLRYMSSGTAPRNPDGVKSPGRKTGASSLELNGFSARYHRMKQHRPELEGMDPTILLSIPLVLITVLQIVIRALS
jgi:hypothetical protein